MQAQPDVTQMDAQQQYISDAKFDLQLVTQAALARHFEIVKDSLLDV